MSGLQQMRVISSPVKVNILQSNSGIVNSANQNLLKVQTISAKADSTHSAEPTSVAIDPKTGIAFKKHHHSVKKFQTPSVSRRNARERNRVKQVNDGFSTLRHHIPHLKNKTSKVDTLRAAVDYIKQLRCLLGQPIKDDQLHQGPVLITDLEESKNSSKHDESFEACGTITTRCDSSLSNPDLSAMVYSLPPMMLVGDFRATSPSSTVSTSSNNQTQDVDSTNGVYYEDLKENLTQNYHLLDPMDINDQGQPNWNWTSVVHDEQQH